MSTPSPTAAPDRALAALVALLTAVTLELVRASGPLVDLALTEGGVLAATVTALVTYLLPGTVAFVLLIAGRGRPLRTTLVVGTALLVVLRLVAQGLDGGSRFVVGLFAVAVAVAVLTLAVAVLAGRPAGGRVAAASLVLGAAAGVGVQLGLGTWDAFWRHTLLGWGVATVVVVALLVAAWAARPDPAAASSPVPVRLWALGPWLALATMMLANPAFAAAQSGLPLGFAGPLHAAGLLLAAWMLGRTRRTRPALAATLLVAGVAAALGLGGLVDGDGALVLLALLLAQLAGTHVLAVALRPTGVASLVPLRLAVTASVVGISTIGPLLAYQLDYDVPLGVPNELVLVLTAAALAAAAVWRAGATTVAASPPEPSRRLLLPACAVVLVGASVAGLGTFSARSVASAPQTPAGTGVVVSWNLHYGVSPTGGVDLESVARTVAAYDPDVVLLQEVSRGWVQGGGVDVATWLSQRLDRPFVFAPAADRRFGNAILARRRPTAVQVHELPYGAGPQQRSAISADVLLGGRTVRVTSVHLQHRSTNTPTRLQQLETLLPRLAGPALGGPEILAGDLNAGPGGPEVGLIGRAGFVSAVDVAGNPRALTSPSSAPRRRIDWLFGRGVGFRDVRVLTDAQQSDHLPLVAATEP